MSATDAPVAVPVEEVKAVETPAVEPAPATEAPAAEQPPPLTEEVAPATVRFPFLFFHPLSPPLPRRHPRKKSPRLP